MFSGSLGTAGSKPLAESGGGKSMESHVHESSALIVRQPEKIQSLLVVLSDIERISERIGEDRSHGLGGGGAATGGATGGAQTQQPSLREQALQSLPSTAVMRERLTKHLQREIRQLERSARRMARRSREGSAYLLSEAYARIRKIHALIAEVLEAAAELVERLYVRLFIDHQQLV